MANVIECDLMLSQGNPKGEILKKFMKYWLTALGGRELPSRQDIDPLDFPYALGNIALIEIIGDRFRFRLDGVNLASDYGEDFTGKYIDELGSDEYCLSMSNLFRTVIKKRKPMHYFRNIKIEGRMLRYEGLCFPLSNDGVNINILIDVMQSHASDMQSPTFAKYNSDSPEQENHLVLM